MKRVLVIVAVAGALLGLAAVASAGDYHTGASLICSDCHVAHGSQTHNYPESAFPAVPVGTAAPYEYLLRNDVNDLCLTCHDGQAWAPDVFGTGTAAPTNGRMAGALNANPAHKVNPTGYEVTDGHTLWSTATAPGGTFSHSGEGLECTDCHAQHGQHPEMYRNLQVSTGATNKFYNKYVTYAITTNDLSMDVFETAAKAYGWNQVNYNEPNTTMSAYGAWCQSCHTNFHGSGGSANMGGASGGDPDGASAAPWLRHPTADVNIGWAASRPHYSSLSQFNGHTNRVKVMDSQGIWTGATGDGTVTPSCFSCHKSHGNQNGFGLIYMVGTGAITEQGDGGVLKDLCRQCHIQGG